MTQTVRASRRKYHIIYKTTCLVTGRYYIGMHSTDDLQDKYLGSGVRLTRSVKKYGKEQHTREILEVFPSRVAASDREKEILTEELRADPLCLNCGAGGLGAVDRPIDTEVTRQKRSEAQLGKVRTTEMRENYSKAFTGKPKSDAHKSAMSNARTGVKWSSERKASHRNGQSGRCTIDGVTIYPSKASLAAELGHGKMGARSPNFRYIDEDRYVQSTEQREKARSRMLGKQHSWKRKSK